MRIIENIFIFIRKLLVLLIGTICFFVTISSVIHLIDFLSWFSERSTSLDLIENNNNNNNINNSNSNNNQTITNNNDEFNSIDNQLINNVGLIILFIVQHSLMATDIVKQAFKNASRSINSLQRSFYLLATSIMIEVIIKYWQPLDSIVVWRFDAIKPYCLTIKLVASIIIVLEFISMFDVFEFTGLKQVYNYITDKDLIKNSDDYSEYEGDDKKKILIKMRHPTLIGLMLLMWSCHKMTIDLFSLCLFFTSYLLIGNSLSKKDHKSIASSWTNLFKIKTK